MDSSSRIIVKRRPVVEKGDEDEDTAFYSSYGSSASRPFSDVFTGSEEEEEEEEEEEVITTPPRRPSRTTTAPSMLTARVLANLHMNRTKLEKLLSAKILPKDSDMENAVKMDMEENTKEMTQVEDQVARMSKVERLHVNACVKAIMFDDFLSMLNSLNCLPSTKHWNVLMTEKRRAMAEDVKKTAVV